MKLFWFSLMMLASLAVLADESCNRILELGLHNVTESSSATDARQLNKSRFCSFDYSRSDISESQAAEVEATYGLFDGGASGSASRSEIIEKQKSLCTSGFSSSAYSNDASAFSRTVYQGTLDAWNKCQLLANNGISFEILPSTGFHGVTVVITASSGVTAQFMGIEQYGEGSSVCKIAAGGKALSVLPNDSAGAFVFSASKKVTITCKREIRKEGHISVADSQDLVFVTSADSLTVPLPRVSSFSKASAEMLRAELEQKLSQELNAIKVMLQAEIADQGSRFRSGQLELESSVVSQKYL